MSVSQSFSNFLHRTRNALRLDDKRQIRLWRLDKTQPGISQAGKPLSYYILPADVHPLGGELVGRDLMSPESSDLRDAQLDEDHTYLAVEQQDADGNWLVAEPPPPTTTTQASTTTITTGQQHRFSDSFFGNMEEKNRSKSQSPTAFELSDCFSGRDRIMTRSQSQASAPSVRGLVGLQNL
jgi:hypothetical protein